MEHLKSILKRESQVFKHIIQIQKKERQNNQNKSSKNSNNNNNNNNNNNSIETKKQIFEWLENQQIFQFDDERNFFNQFSQNKQDQNQTCQSSWGKKQQNILSYFPFIENIQQYQRKCNDLKCNYVSQRRKDDLFKRLKKQQQERFIRLKRQAEKNYAYIPLAQIKGNGQITLKTAKAQQHLSITASDLAKLLPQVDLNDTIVGIYLKIILLKMLDPQVSQQTHIFSSFLFGMLIGQISKDQNKQVSNQQIKTLVQANFSKVKRWTRKSNIFEKKYLVFPINGWYHWNCIILVNPNCLIQKKPGAYMVYCDSMIQKKAVVIQTIHNYFRCLIKQKTQQDVDISLSNLPVYQLLLPRQTNAHDCGLYMMCFIELLLMNPQQINCDMKNIQNRLKLNLFPRTLAFSMRDRLKKLFDRLHLANGTGKQQEIINQYKLERQRIFQKAQENLQMNNFKNKSNHLKNLNEDKSISQDMDQQQEESQFQSNNDEYDTIEEKQFDKFFKINMSQEKQKECQNHEEYQYEEKVRFYLDLEINFYEKN